MQLKYFIMAPSIAQAAQFYQKLFQAEIMKQDHHHAKLKLFDQVEILIAQSHGMRAQDGILILRFADDEKTLYQRTLKQLKVLKVNVEIANYAGKWGTTFTEFSDPFGYRWDLEISTAALTDKESRNA